MADRPGGSGGQEASPQVYQFEVKELSENLKELINARQKWLVSTQEFEETNPLENMDVLRHPEFKELIRELAHENMVQILLFRIEAHYPTRIRGNPPNHLSYLYPLRIPRRLSAHSAYPGTSDSTAEELRLGQVVVFGDRVFIDGPLDFLFISCRRVNYNNIGKIKDEGTDC